MQKGEPACAGRVPLHSRQFLLGSIRARLWTFRQYSGFSTARESNARYRYLLDQGGTGLSVAHDLPTQCGYGSDDAGSTAGRSGASASRWTPWPTPGSCSTASLDKISTSFTINGTAAIPARVLRGGRRERPACRTEN